MSTTENSCIGVIGLGNWGTALAHCLSQRHGSVLAWTREVTVRSSIRSSGRNCRYLPDTPLHGGINIKDSIGALTGCDKLILALPSKALAEISNLLSSLNEDTIIISASKGFDPETRLTPLQLLKKLLPKHKNRVVISGPSFAADLLRGLPIAVVAGSEIEDAARSVADIFSGTTVRVYLSDDPLGVELGGILKNAIAIAAGISDGLELGDSARAAVITRGLAEMRPFFSAAGAQNETLFGLSGLGDLVMTASSPLSRNRNVGFRLGQGESLSSIINSLGSVAEGVPTIYRVVELASEYGIKMPICEEMKNILDGVSTPAEALKNLLKRPQKREFLNI